MAALSAGSVTYAVKNQRRLGNSKVCNLIKLSFGDGSSTWPAGGLALDGGKMGCPNAVESVEIVSNYSAASGYVFNYNVATGKIEAYRCAASANSAALAQATGDAPAATVVDVQVIGW